MWEPLTMAAEDDKKLSALGERLIEQVIEFGINGGGPFKGAVPIADEHLLAANGHREEAVRRLVATHVRLAAASGFTTGLGGIVMLPFSIPAAVTGLYIVATRMSAGIAHLHGYEVDTEEVRSAILVTLLGSAGATALKRTGIEVGKNTIAAALQKIPGRVLIELNKRVGYRLVTKAGEKGVINLTKLVPLVGRPIGAAVDAVSCKTIASYARRTFKPQEHIAARRSRASAEPDVIDAEIVDRDDMDNDK
jgi:EcsC protein family